jgi:glycogen debranching enzyme
MSLFTIETYGELHPHLEQEWLLTNGLGGFAFSTVAGCNARRYHGLLCAATLPPVGRVMALSRVGEVLVPDGADLAHAGAPMIELAVNQFGPDNFHPRGDRYLRRFELGETARWAYEADGFLVTKELQVLWLKNVVAVRYTIEPDRERRVQLNLLPFVALRDFHALRRADGVQFKVEPDARNERLAHVGVGALDLRLWSDNGRFVKDSNWWYGHTYRIESERGQDDKEDLFQPGRFVLETAGRATVTLWAALRETGKAHDWGAGDEPAAYDFDRELARRKEAVGASCRLADNRRGAGGSPPALCDPPTPALKKLTRAANDFVVFRRAPDGSDGTTVIAGYPWFADWGRDTMIALPGLFLVTGRFAQARQVLTVFAQYVSEGMIPNRFDDYTNQPHYNTVDASLWFVHACFEYLRRSGDHHTFESHLLTACRAIVKGYRDGTRFGIRMDPADGLITQGDEKTQLTWMDAKFGDIAFTPRQGKPVEINALWYNALVLMNEKELAARVADSFRKKFWISPFRGLADVIGEGDRKDQRVRPNQIFAASLPNSPLGDEQQSAVVEVVRRELLTPVGLRTLARNEPGYINKYTGDQFQRDSAYHNGVVWAWPMGAFVEAYLKVNRRSPAALDQARRWLQPLVEAMDHTGCVGQIAEIFDPEEPHRPKGCTAQAWSVAEVLRMAVEVGM